MSDRGAIGMGSRHQRQAAVAGLYQHVANQTPEYPAVMYFAMVQNRFEATGMCKSS
jgi:hypothetical protein